ncbi:uncharacterized protein LOC120803300 isoform X1 [Xiphias gladius]|uniref:uncharacterized protein LOC120803300 isoform X1 n=1 Tax=Xiphias gladius TaxID=8245 RepID=UPI001A98D797|nr:uncharacterized protein LOC120803300 isoform X1 [Xiphias gladius]XP_040007572.1 uncharacterized protein LOC120803300 isoform X1 [Xiphias gladius]XP_040007573.1 uncharacterized protein LOC120803300 isoform X1 [Xiphias gladius]
MKIVHTLICCFYLSLQGGIAQIFIYSGPEGGNVTVECPVFSWGTTKIFCKETCETGNVLIDTRESSQRGRYRIDDGGNRVSVTITGLTKSDSGMYSCSRGTTVQTKLEIIVTDVQLDGTRGPSEEKPLYKRAGGNVTVKCIFRNGGEWKYFCKEECKEVDILVETPGFLDQRGKYSLRYLTDSLTRGFVFVTVTQLTKSDSGRYRCGVGRRSRKNFWDFEIIVTDVPSASTPPATSSSTSSAFRKINNLPPESEAPNTEAATDTPLYVGLTLAAVVVLLTVAVLIFCKKRIYKPKEPPEGKQDDFVAAANRVYDDIREEASFQRKDEDDSSKCIYARVNFSSKTAGPSSSDPCGDDGSVIYSVLQAEASSGASRT